MKDDLESTAAPWLAVIEAEERLIGECVATVLFPRLTHGLSVLADLPGVDPDRQGRILREASVIGAGPVGLALAQVGLTPLSIVLAARGVASLANRKGGNLRPLKVAFGHGEAADIGREEIDREVALMCELDRERATALATWVLDAARIVDRLVPGYGAAASAGCLVLERQAFVEDDLGVAWST
jgi:hypothetical protein